MTERYERHRQAWTHEEIQKLHMLVTKGMKVYLYVLMIVTPVFGWMYLSANEESIVWFIVPLPAIAPVSETLAEFAEEAHEMSVPRRRIRAH